MPVYNIHFIEGVRAPKLLVYKMALMAVGGRFVKRTQRKTAAAVVSCRGSAGWMAATPFSGGVPNIRHRIPGPVSKLHCWLASN